MKKTVLTFGLISGFIMIAMMTLTLSFSERIGFGHSLVLGLSPKNDLSSNDARWG